MPKVVFNADYGGFGLSRDALQWLIDRGHGHLVENLPDYGLRFRPARFTERHNFALVAVVEALGEKANDDYSCLRVANIKGNRYMIDVRDGFEAVIEPEDIEWIMI